MAFDNPPIFAEAGDYFHVSYDAFDSDLGLRHIDLNFSHDEGNGHLSFSDSYEDGLASGRIDANAPSGDYTLNYVSLSDSENNIEYRDDGSTAVYDSQNDQWIYGTHDFVFSDFAFTVTGGLDPQTDFTPPELIGIGLDEPVAEAGDYFHVSYDAFDSDLGLRHIDLNFSHDEGNGHLSFSDSYEDGLASGRIDANAPSGDYTLNYVSLSDSENNIEYRDDGSTAVYDSQNDQWIYGTHDFVFSDMKFSVVAGETNTGPQTDFTPPEMRSITVLSSEVKADEPLNVSYDAFDAGEGVRSIDMVFQNAEGNSIHLSDFEGDDVVSNRIASDAPNGEYSLSQFSLYDDAYSSNSISYSSDGTTYYYDNGANQSIHGTHDLIFSDIAFNVTGGQDPQTDFTPPEMRSITVLSSEVKADEPLNVSYDAFDAGEGVRSIDMVFQNAEGNSIHLSDFEGDDVVSNRIASDAPNGEYSLSQFSLYDDAYSSNSINYSSDGTTYYYDNGANQSIHGTHDLIFSDIAFNVTGGQDPQTDFTPPEMRSITVLSSEVKADEPLNVSYDAFDAGEGVRSIDMVFQNAEGNSIHLSDFEGDDVVSNRIASDAPNGEYSLSQFSLYDDAYSSNSISYSSDGTTYYYDNGANQSIHGTHDLIFSDIAFNVIPAETNNGSQTDFTPPELIGIGLDEPVAEAGDYFHVSYDAFDSDLGLRHIDLNFSHDEGNGHLSFSDSYEDGLASGRIDANAPSGDYTLNYVSLSDSENNIEYRDDGSTAVYDSQNDQWIYGTHDFVFSDFAFTVTGGLDPQSDFTPPELLSISLPPPELPIEILGTEGDDQLEGSRWEDEIYGYGGDDTIAGHGGDDFLFGGGGDDTYIYRFDGADVIIDESGNDTLWSVSRTEDGTRLFGEMYFQSIQAEAGEDLGAFVPSDLEVPWEDGFRTAEVVHNEDDYHPSQRVKINGITELGGTLELDFSELTSANGIVPGYVYSVRWYVDGEVVDEQINTNWGSMNADETGLLKTYDLSESSVGKSVAVEVLYDYGMGLYSVSSNEFSLGSHGREILVIEGHHENAPNSSITATGIENLHWTADDGSYDPISTVIFNESLHTLDGTDSFSFIGTSGQDIIKTNSTDAYTDVYSGYGDDVITISGSGETWTSAGKGSDEVHGGTGSDTIYGDGVNGSQFSESDFIQAEAGEDLGAFVPSDLEVPWEDGFRTAEVVHNEDDYHPSQRVKINGITELGGTLELDFSELTSANGIVPGYVYSVRWYVDGEVVDEQINTNWGSMNADETGLLKTYDLSESSVGKSVAVEVLYDYGMGLYSVSSNEFSLGGSSLVVNDDYLMGHDGDDEIHGGVGNDELLGGSGSDELYGNDGDDVLRGGPDRDILEGGAGNDYLYGGGGATSGDIHDDVLKGGDGDDYLDASEGSVEVVDGNVTNWGASVLPGKGNDTVIGHEELYNLSDGIDLAYYDLSGVDGITFTVGENGTGTAVSGNGEVNDTFTFAHYFIGSQDNDIFYGSDTSDDSGQIEGFIGLEGSDQIFGGGGIDRLDYSAGSTEVGINVDYSSGTVIDQWGDTDTFSGIEVLRASNSSDYISAEGHDESIAVEARDGDDVIIGGSGDDIIDGEAGNDDLNSGAGDDEVYGGDGDDIIRQTGSGTQLYDGGSGNDTYILELENWDFEAGFIGEVDLATEFSGAHLDPANVLNDKVRNIENVTLHGDINFIIRGDAADNILIADGGDDTLEGGAGSDMLYGGAGDDTAFFSGAASEYEIVRDGAVVYVTETAFGHVDHVEGFELLQFGDGTTMNIGYELVSGGSGDDWLIGGLEDDLIATNGGNDFVYGLAGDDRIEISGVGDVVVDTGEGADEIVIADNAQGSIEIITSGTDNTLLWNGSTEGGISVNADGDLLIGDESFGLSGVIREQMVLDAQLNKYVIRDSGFKAVIFSDTEEDLVPDAGVFGSDHQLGDYLTSVGHSGDNFIIAGGGADTIVLLGGDDQSARTFVGGDILNYESEDDDQTQNISYGDELRFAWAHEDVEITDLQNGFYEVEYVGVGEDAGKVVQFTDIEKLVFEGGANAPVEIQVIDGPVVGSEEWFADGNDWGGAAAGQQVSHGDNNVEFQIAGDTIKVYADISETITWTETETRTVKETYKDSKGRTKTRNVQKTFEVEKSEDVTHEGELIWQGSHNDISGFSFSDDEYVNVISVREFDIGGNAIEMTLGTEDTDLIFGTESDNVIFGAGGDDLIVGGGGNDTILGGSGEDAILGGMGDDLLLGDWDVDVLQDEFGLSEEEIAALLANQLNDGSNDDLVIGGDGIDEVDGGEGRNVVISGGTDLDINQDGDANIQDIEDLIGKDLFDDEHWV